jgi:hypothetical protein
MAQPFRDALAALRKATKPEDVAKTTKAMTDLVIGHQRGNVAGTRAVLTELKAQLAKTHDSKLAAQLRAAIAAVEKKVVGRVWIDKQIDQAAKIANSTESSKDKIKDLTAIQRRLLDRGDTHAAAAIGRKIDAEKNKVSDAIKAADAANVAAILAADERPRDPIQIRPSNTILLLDGRVVASTQVSYSTGTTRQRGII